MYFCDIFMTPGVLCCAIINPYVGLGDVYTNAYLQETLSPCTLYSAVIRSQLQCYIHILVRHFKKMLSSQRDLGEWTPEGEA